jgi:hypothetical protein
MNTIDIKQLVGQAVRQEWPNFAAAHPHLAQVLGEDLIVESATSSLLDDPAYQQAMKNATAAGLAGEAVGDVVARLVKRFLETLL